MPLRARMCVECSMHGHASPTLSAPVTGLIHGAEAFRTEPVGSRTGLRAIPRRPACADQSLDESGATIPLRQRVSAISACRIVRASSRFQQPALSTARSIR
jgi:hypothetical protein